MQEDLRVVSIYKVHEVVLFRQEFHAYRWYHATTCILGKVRTCEDAWD